jgi:DNA-binding NarL/FixJ family response regulator
MTITVFLADDHTLLREGLRVLLEREKDIQVVGDAADGLDAVRQIAQLQPDIAVLDILMPYLNGIETTQHLRSESPHTRVLILSMFGSREHIYRALQAGASGYIMKDAIHDEIAQAIRMVWAKQRYLSPAVAAELIDDYLTVCPPPEERDPLDLLSLREREVLQLVVEGHTSQQIAQTLALSLHTVDSYRSRLMQKLGLTNLPALVKFAIRRGLTSVDW